MTTKPYGKKRKIQLTLTLDPDLIADLRRASKAEGVSVSHSVNRILKDHASKE